MRLDRFLAECGFGTRTEVKKLIKMGAVKIEGCEKLRPETKIDPKASTVFVNGEMARYSEFIYLLLNKPSGFVSATWDKKFPTAVDLVPEKYRHFDVFPVGRLDIDTEGLLLLTNDGDLAHRLLSPKHHVPKTYVARLERKVSDKDVRMFEEGIDLGDFVTLSASLKSLSDNEPYWAEVIICEGKFHQVKRMFEKCDNKVLYLRRTRMKNLCLDESQPLGEVRELTPKEIEDLRA